MTTDTCQHGLPPENCANCRAKAAAVMAGITPRYDMSQLSPWPEQRPERCEGDRVRFAEHMSAHLPKPDAFSMIHFSEADLNAIKAAYIRRFDEQLPRTETMMAVASVGYRMALRDMMAGSSDKPKT